MKTIKLKNDHSPELTRLINLIFKIGKEEDVDKVEFFTISVDEKKSKVWVVK